MIMSLKDEILELIFGYIVKKKVNKLEKVFTKDQTIMKSIRDMHGAYLKINDKLTDYCKKNPEKCKDVLGSKTGV